MDAPIVELMTALATMFETGKYSDLTITCGTKSYAVHRALLASRSTFFDGVCRNPFREAEIGVIDLSEDEAEIVDLMVNYFYHLDYLSKPSSWRLSQPSASSTSSPCFPQRRTPKKLNLALIEDPLLATMATNTSALPTPPAEQPAQVELHDSAQFDQRDSFSKFPDTPVANKLAENPLDCNRAEMETDVEKPHLITHAKVYAIAEKYDIPGLKSLACKKFVQQVEAHIDSEEFPEACQEVYESTVDSDRGLRDIVVQTFRSHPNLSNREDVEMAIRNTPGLAFELFRMASGLPVTSLA